jgi:uncharacterized membrane protein
VSATTARGAHSTPYARPLHPLHAILLGFPLPLFLGALFSDIAYWQTYQVQWANFASWLIAGALVFGGFALLAALIGLIRSRPHRRRHAAFYLVALLAMWVVGLFNALVHGKDAFAIMPEALYLSAATTLLALIAAWLGYAGDRTGGVW